MIDFSLHVDVDDRRVVVSTYVSDPLIVVFDGLLCDSECDALISAASPRMKRSMTVDSDIGDEKVHPSRTSNGMFFKRGELDVVARIEARISTLVDWPVDRGEGLQVLQYLPGAEYKPHYDYFDPSFPGTAGILKRGGQRVATLIMYLSDPEEGGLTSFPDVHLKVTPKRGSAVFFTYPVADPTSNTLHGGEPVVLGEKWIATKWFRETVFN